MQIKKKQTTLLKLIFICCILQQTIGHSQEESSEQNYRSIYNILVNKKIDKKNSSTFCCDKWQQFLIKNNTSTSKKISKFLIKNIVNPISGQPILKKIDLIANGTQEISLKRMYTTMHSAIVPKYKKQEIYAHTLSTHLHTNYKGWLYLQHAYLSANFKFNTITIMEPNGEVYIHNIDDPKLPKQIKRKSFSVLENKKKIIVHDKTIKHYTYIKSNENIYRYKLDKEILQNGKILKYKYDENNKISSIDALDQNERYIYSSINIDRTTSNDLIRFFTSSNTKAIYFYQSRQDNNYTKHKFGYSAYKIFFPSVLSIVWNPFNVNEEMEYNDHHLLTKYKNISLSYQSIDGQFKVKAIDDSIINYEQNNTFVKNNDGNITHYHFSKNLYPIFIKQYYPNGEVKYSKNFEWDGDNLSSIDIKDDIRDEKYKFDTFNNIIEEKKSNKPIITREFSQDGRNLLLREDDVYYNYISNTNLIKEKFIPNQMYATFTYDENNNLIQITIEDLISNEQKIIEYLLKKDQPFIHMPKTIRIDNKTSIDLSYDKWGNVSKEDVYINNIYSHSTCREFDEHELLSTNTENLNHLDF